MKPKWSKIGQRSWRMELNGQVLVLIKEKDGTTTVDQPQGFRNSERVTVAKGLSWEQAKEMATIALNTAKPPTAVSTPNKLEDYAVNVVSEGRDVQYCDNCGEVLKDDGVGYSELPFNVASANKGESAVICHDCDKKLNPKKRWRVSCVWQEMGDYFIEAASEEEAREIAMAEPLPKESSYLDDSFEIDSISEVKE